MARKKDSPAEQLLFLVGRLPWWAGVALALVSWLVLHHIAGRPVPTMTPPGRVSGLAFQSFERALAGIGQVVLPLICLAGAGLSAWRQQERKRLAREVTHSDAGNVLDGMSWQQFERLTGEALARQGYRVEETGRGGADGGVDLVLKKSGETYLVQCKQWRAYRVGVDVVRELYGVMAARGAAGGFVVTSGRFTAEATSFAEGRNVRLVDGTQLKGWFRQEDGPTRPPSRSAPASRSGTTSSPSSTREREREPAYAEKSAGIPKAADAPSCPVCSRSMVRRTASRGANAGRAFWGCSGYPTCRGTRAAG